jgi:hypothetical protein
MTVAAIQAAAKGLRALVGSVMRDLHWATTAYVGRLGALGERVHKPIESQGFLLRTPEDGAARIAHEQDHPPLRARPEQAFDTSPAEPARSTRHDKSLRGLWPACDIIHGLDTLPALQNHHGAV